MAIRANYSDRQNRVSLHFPEVLECWKLLDLLFSPVPVQVSRVAPLESKVVWWHSLNLNIFTVFGKEFSTPFLAAILPFLSKHFHWVKYFLALILSLELSLCFFLTENFPNGNGFLTYEENYVICTSSNIPCICHAVYTELSCVRIQPVFFMGRLILTLHRHWGFDSCAICDVLWDRKLDYTFYEIVKYGTI